MDSKAVTEEVFRSLEEDTSSPPMDLQRLTAEEAPAVAQDFAGMIEVWKSKRGASRLPDWSDFDFPDFRGWHSDLVLSVFQNDEPDPYFILSGETFSRVVDFNFKGVFFSDCWPRLYDLQFRDHFRAIRDEGLIGLTEGKVATANRSFHSVRILELPVRDGGEGVKRMIHLVRVLNG